MFEKARKAGDAFAFSLGGMTAVSPFVAVPAVADDRINRIRDEKIRQARETRNHEARGWLGNCTRPAHDCV